MDWPRNAALWPGRVLYTSLEATSIVYKASAGEEDPVNLDFSIICMYLRSTFLMLPKLDWIRTCVWTLWAKHKAGDLVIS